MTTPFILSVVGTDSPGVLRQLAQLIHQHQGKWLNSKVANLEGVFTALIKLDLPASQVQQLQEALLSLPNLQVRIHESQPAADVDTRQLKFKIDAEDQPGLVNDITNLLESHSINVDKLDSHRFNIPGTHYTAFEADIVITAPAELDPDVIAMELEGLHEHIKVHKVA